MMPSTQGQLSRYPINGDPLRHHTSLTAEQFALDSRLMAKQAVTNVLTALKREPRPC